MTDNRVADISNKQYTKYAIYTENRLETSMFVSMETIMLQRAISQIQFYRKSDIRENLFRILDLLLELSENFISSLRHDFRCTLYSTCLCRNKLFNRLYQTAR